MLILNSGLQITFKLTGYGCATTASGSAVFTQRNLQVCGRQSFDSLCLKDLDKKYLGITSLDAGSYNTTWKLAETYSELIVNQMAHMCLDVD